MEELLRLKELEELTKNYIKNKNLESKQTGSEPYLFDIKNFFKYKDGFYFYVWYNNMYSFVFLKINKNEDLINYIDKLNHKLCSEKIMGYPYRIERESKFCEICNLQN